MLQLDEEAITLLNNTDTVEAQDRVDAYGEEQCGITLGDEG